MSGNSHGKPLPNTHFHETEDSVTHEKKRSLTPNSHWTEFVRTLETKQVYDFQNETIVNQLIEEWQFNPFQKVMNEPMRLQFFGKILANLEPKKSNRRPRKKRIFHDVDLWKKRFHNAAS